MLDTQPHTAMAQHALTLITGWLFVLLLNSQVPSAGCQKTPEAMPINCTSNDTKSLYAEVKEALWSKEIRPVTHPSEVLSVKLGITVSGIVDVDEKKQTVTLFIVKTLDWLVPFLKWDYTTCGFENISYPASELWLPSLQIAEHMDEDKGPNIPYLQLNYTGGVHFVELRRVAASCRMDIYKFPFDVQNCSLTFRSFLNEENELKLSAKSATFTLNSSVVSESGWSLVNVTEVSSMNIFTSRRSYSSVKYSIILKREASIYVVNLLVPSCFLSLLDLFSFFLPAQNADRSAFKITLILGYTVFLLITNDLLPDAAIDTPIINVFFSLSLALMVASVLESMFIVKLSNSSGCYRRVPRWLHILVLDYLARLLFMSSKCTAAPIPVALNPQGQVTLDMSGKTTITAEAGDKGKMEGAAVVEELKKVARDVLTIRLRMEEHLRPKQDDYDDWTLITNVIDRLLFLLYVLFVLVSYITIIAVWLKH